MNRTTYARVPLMPIGARPPNLGAGVRCGRSGAAVPLPDRATIGQRRARTPAPCTPLTRIVDPLARRVGAVTVPLHVGSKPVGTVFDLLGSAENDLTYALGWALAKAAGFARTLMTDVFGQDVGDVVAVNLQRFGPDGGFTDVEVIATGGHLIVEAKRDWQVPQRVQLERYRSRPGGVPAVLLSLSAASRQWALRQDRLPQMLGDVHVDHRSWSDLAHLAETRAIKATGGSKNSSSAT